MRNRFEQQHSIDITPIEEVQIDTKCRDAFPALLRGLQHVYMIQELNKKVCQIIANKVTGGKKATGRKGMGLWELFVMAQVRLGLNIGYDRLHHLANNDRMMRQIMGIEISRRDWGEEYKGKHYEYQNIYDNVTLLDDETLMQVNDVIVEAGHGVFKKKEEEALRIKTDSFVVESNVHFPTDYNLLWDAGRKCLDSIKHIIKKYPCTPGWRKLKNWRNELKNLMRTLSRASAGGGKNKQQRQEQAAKNYVAKACVLSKKLDEVKKELPCEDTLDLARLMELDYFHQMLDKHIDLVERRLLKGEKIPHQEKLFSIFETYTEWITKGKSRPNVELGKKLLVSTDQYNLVVDYQIMENQADSDAAIGTADRLLSKYEIDSISFDKGFWSLENRALLSLYIPKVVLPKKGKLNQQEKELESNGEFKRLRNAHSAVESNINELEHRGLDRCPDQGYDHFKRYIGLGICAYNLHKIGKELIRQEKTAQEKERNRALKKAA